VSSGIDKDKRDKPKPAFSRRGFIKGVGLGGGAIGSGILEQEAEAQSAGGSVSGPGITPITLQINGKPRTLKVEPRVTLLDALRDHLDLTGAKRVCDRGTCGACTVMMDGKAVYACTVLAIDAQGRKIETIESLSANGSRRDPVIAAFVNHDAQQCGYCTPGFVMAAKAFLAHHPDPTMEQISQDLGGNLCRCGTYVGVQKAVMEAARDMKGARRG